MDVERVASYKYLGVHQNNKLDWSDNTGVLLKMGEQTLPTPVEKQGPLMRTVDDFVVAPAIFYGVVCWAGNVCPGKKETGWTGRRASSVLGCTLDRLSGGGRRSIGDRQAGICSGEPVPSPPEHLESLSGTGNNDCSVRHASPVDNIRPTMHSHM